MGRTLFPRRCEDWLTDGGRGDRAAGLGGIAVSPAARLASARGLRTSRYLGALAGWALPYWMQRQLDPESPGHCGPGELPFVANTTQRDWTALGSLGSRHRPVVDPRGLVTPELGGWSLDWWVGAEDRWRLPSREAGVRQSLLAAAPVVETRMRLPHGDAVHRAFVARAAQDADRELVVVEVENDSAAPVALALVLRPFDPLGVATLTEIALEGERCMVAGARALLLPKPPSRVAASNLEGGDVAAAVLGGRAQERLAGPVRCPDGLAQLALLFPLAHRACLRVAVPLGARPARRARARRRGGVAREAPEAPEVPGGLPAPAQVAAGWAAHADRGVRVELPDPRLAAAVAASRRHLLAHPGGRSGVAIREADALVASALGRWGYVEHAGEALGDLAGRQRADGHLGEDLDSRASGCALWALAHQWRLRRDSALAAASAPVVAGAVGWLERARRRGGDGDPRLAGMLPAGVPAGHLGPPRRAYLDVAWAVAGAAGAAELLAAAGERRGAADAARACGGLVEALEASLSAVAGRTGSLVIPAGPDQPLDAGAAGFLDAAWLLGVLAPSDPRIVATLEEVRARWCHGAAVHQAAGPAGLSPRLTAALAGVELALGDPRAAERLEWLLGAASPTWAWPSAIDPRSGGGSGGEGHDVAITAVFMLAVRDLLVREAPGGLALASLAPQSWLGRSWEVHDAPTGAGRLSYAVRWHGERPALLWQLEPHPGEPPARLAAPGLDPAWSTVAPAGEALLAPIVGQAR